MVHLQLHGPRVLVAQLSGAPMRAIAGSMVAYEGAVTFKHAGMGGGDGLKAALKRRVTGESLSLMEVAGKGTVYFADDAQEITLVQLAGDLMQVEASQLLALAGDLRTDVRFTGLRGATSGQGLFTTTVAGTGTIALLSSGGPPIALAVTPQYPLVVDPDAFVAYHGQLQQSFITDVTWKSVLGGGNGEAFSLRFDGQGVVYIQPEER